MALRSILFCLAALLALAQTPATKRPIHIDGTVIEKESRAPIPNAEVTLGATENSDGQRTTSDANGRFSFDTIEPKELALPLQIRAEAPGYITAIPDVAGSNLEAMLPVLNGGGALRITRDKTNYTAELTLSRAATLAGTLIDQESKKPLAKLSVSAQRRTYTRGEVTFFPGGGGGRPVTTGADGTFHFDGLSPGEYVLQIQDPLKPVIESLPPGNLPAPGEGALGYGNVVIPGGTPDVPEFASISLRAGAAVDADQIPLRQQRLRNFAGTVDSDCRDADRVTIFLKPEYGKVSYNGGTSQKIDCGPFRILNVPEGTDSIALWILGGAGGGYGAQPLSLRSSDPIHLRVQPRGTVNGVIEVEDVPADQFPKDLEGLYVGFNPKSMPNLMGDTVNPPSVNGKFQAVMYGGATYEVLTRLPETYYIKRVFYNDVEQPDSMRLTATPGVLNHTVRIVLSTKPATFQAQADAGSAVILVRDDPDPARRYSERVVLAASRPQQILIKRGLRPGSYHAFAIPTAQLSALELPGGLDRLLLNAQTVRLEEGQSTQVNFATQ